MTSLTRAEFIRVTNALGVGLALAIDLPGCAGRTERNATFSPNAWVRIAPDDMVTIVVSKSEMGQGVATGLPTILADELDAAMERVQFEFAPADPRYNDPLYQAMITGGSTSVQDGWMPLRVAGATARAMLVAAAAEQWSVDPSSCQVRSGVVYHQASNRRATFGSLTARASSMPVPGDVALKTPDRFTLIGKPRARLDLVPKVNGTAQFGIDYRMPGMVFAAVARPAEFGATVRSYDASKARAIPGVLDVVQISNGVAVVAKNTWTAFKGRDALKLDITSGPNSHVSSASILADAQRLARSHTDERVAVDRGDPNTSDGVVLEAAYHAPFLAHATMEPQNATAYVREDQCDVWAPTQTQTRAQAAAAKITGLPPEKCFIHTTLLGGGFGRRLESDYVEEAVEVAKALKVPVKVMWTREDDIQHDFYRPLSLNVVRGVVRGKQLVALTHQIV